MSLTKTVSQTIAQTFDRTAITTISTQLNEAAKVTFHRQLGTKDSSGNVVNADPNLQPVNRLVSDLPASVTLTDSTVITKEQLSEAVAKFSDACRTQDLTPKVFCGSLSGVAGSAVQPLQIQENDSSTEDPVFSASGLPSGLSIDAATGIVSGTPASAGTATAAITATNSVGSGSCSLPISIAAAPTL